MLNPFHLQFSLSLCVNSINNQHRDESLKPRQQIDQSNDDTGRRCRRRSTTQPLRRSPPSLSLSLQFSFLQLWILLPKRYMNVTLFVCLFNFIINFSFFGINLLSNSVAVLFLFLVSMFACLVFLPSEKQGNTIQ